MISFKPLTLLLSILVVIRDVNREKRTHTLPLSLHTHDKLEDGIVEPFYENRFVNVCKKYLTFIRYYR